MAGGGTWRGEGGRDGACGPLPHKRPGRRLGSALPRTAPRAGLQHALPNSRLCASRLCQTGVSVVAGSHAPLHAPRPPRQPLNDLRYVTTYIGGGARQVTCHTFQRKYSRRYVAQGAPLPPGAAEAFAADASLAYGASGAAGDEAPDPLTGQGAVDPSLKMEFRKLTHHLVREGTNGRKASVLASGDRRVCCGGAWQPARCACVPPGVGRGGRAGLG
jgi:hypothetical protein